MLDAYNRDKNQTIITDRIDPIAFRSSASIASSRVTGITIILYFKSELTMW